MHMREVLPLLGAIVLLGGCGSQTPQPVNFGPKPIIGPVHPAIATKSLDRPPLSSPRARPPHDLVRVH